MSERPRANPAGVLLVVLGLFFLVAQFVNVDWGSLAWPFFIIVPGALLLTAALMGGKSAAGLAIPGSIVTTVGLILFVQNLTGRFESWAYAWGLILVSVGVGQYLRGQWAGEEAMRRSGLRFAALGLLLFLLFGIFFELFIFNQSPLLRNWWPLILIGIGAFLLLRQRR
jgi:drug/metabolite transporter (DMT)-like permease